MPFVGRTALVNSASLVSGPTCPRYGNNACLAIGGLLRQAQRAELGRPCLDTFMLTGDLLLDFFFALLGSLEGILRLRARVYGSRVGHWTTLGAVSMRDHDIRRKRGSKRAAIL